MAKRNQKPILFISHISEEKEAANLLKEFFENAFLDAIKVFVSSNEKSIYYGSRWLNQITTALQNCDLMLILCSWKSVQRPWINYEAGFGSGRNVNVIPICYAGQDKGQLPAPLSFYQGLNLFDPGILESLIEQIADTIDMRCPSADCEALLGKIKHFEDRYLFWNTCNAAFEELEKCSPYLVNNLKAYLPDNEYEFEVVGNKNLEIFDGIRKGFFANSNILIFSDAIRSAFYSDMEFGKTYTVTPTKRFFDEILPNPEFKFK
ncbi:MAG: toll/interleukin-1 receptor domain-containing protein [Ruminococcus bromii]|nr:toll/interleukin-1 receptor domain-containing protein [Ruminococcus bromii]